jgi:hypothetical protein
LENIFSSESTDLIVVLWIQRVTRDYNSKSKGTKQPKRPDDTTPQLDVSSRVSMAKQLRQNVQRFQHCSQRLWLQRRSRGRKRVNNLPQIVFANEWVVLLLITALYSMSSGYTENWEINRVPFTNQPAAIPFLEFDKNKLKWWIKDKDMTKWLFCEQSIIFCFKWLKLWMKSKNDSEYLVNL